MATVPVHHLVGNRTGFDTLAKKLKEDLIILDNMLKDDKQQLILTGNGQDTFFVYAPIQYKAYIPKNYEGCKIEFIEWNGSDQVQFCLVEEIYL